MKRRIEPELMNDPAQCEAYARADFEAAHGALMAKFCTLFPAWRPDGPLLDLGCGPADFSVRLTRCFPHVPIDAVDGAEEMLRLARARVASEGLSERIDLHRCKLPQDPLPRHQYAGILSNSLLHHLHDPSALWRTLIKVAAAEAVVFVADLMRPPSSRRAHALVAQYSGEEPEILRRDFYNSLLAAFTPMEVAAQLRASDLAELRVVTLSDRHLAIYGRMPA